MVFIKKIVNNYKRYVMDKILIVISGGVVQGVFSSKENIKVDILDFDNNENLDDKSAKMEFEKRKQGLKEILWLY